MWETTKKSKSSKSIRILGTDQSREGSLVSLSRPQWSSSTAPGRPLTIPDFIFSANVDLQLPQVEEIPSSATPELPPEPKQKFKERVITSLGDQSGPTSFRKTKTQNGKSRNLRQRDDDWNTLTFTFPDVYNYHCLTAFWQIGPLFWLTGGKKALFWGLFLCIFSNMLKHVAEGLSWSRCVQNGFFYTT